MYQRVGEQHYYHHPHQVSEPNRSVSKSPSVFSSSAGTPHLVMSHSRQPHSKIAKVIRCELPGRFLTCFEIGKLEGS